MNLNQTNVSRRIPKLPLVSTHNANTEVAFPVNKKYDRFAFLNSNSTGPQCSKQFLLLTELPSQLIQFSQNTPTDISKQAQKRNILDGIFVIWVILLTSFVAGPLAVTWLPKK